MIKSILASLLILNPFTAFAGDGGYTVYACTSASGRTQLNILSDNYSGSEKPYTIRLIIDGQMAEYASLDNESSNIVYDYDNGTFSVREGNVEVLALKVTDSSATIRKGFQDPRVGTQFEHYGDNTRDIVTTCKRYYQEP